MVGINAAVITMGIFMAGLMFLYRMAFGSRFLLASQFVSAKQFPLPASPVVNTFTGIAGGHAWLTIVNSVWVIALLFYIGAVGMVAVTRNMLAWSIDGVAPGWMSAVSEKYHTPTWSLLACGAVSMGVLCIYSFTHLITVLGGLLRPVRAVHRGQPRRRRVPVPAQAGLRRILGLPKSRRHSADLHHRACCRSSRCQPGFWRLLVDKNYGANNHLSIWFTVGVAAFGMIWFYGFKYWSKHRGVNVERRFEEIPIE